MKVGLMLHKKIQGSSLAERSVVNRLAVGSNPTPGANPFPEEAMKCVRPLAIVENPYDTSEQFTIRH
jgi:hypothetical protein